MSQKDQSFKIETLSPSASKPEVLNGVEAAFQVAVPGGEMVTLRLLQHTRLEMRQMKLKSNLLTCSENFANKYGLKRAGLSEPCSNGQHCLMRHHAKLSIILGMDVHHVQPKLVEEFKDQHGSLGLYMCSLSNSLILCGNRVYPYTPAEARSALAQNTNSFGVTTEEAAELEEEDSPALPSTSLFHGAL